MNTEANDKNSEQILRDLLSQDLPISDKPAEEFKIIGKDTQIIIKNVSPSED